MGPPESVQIFIIYRQHKVELCIRNLKSLQTECSVIHTVSSRLARQSSQQLMNCARQPGKFLISCHFVGDAELIYIIKHIFKVDYFTNMLSWLIKNCLHTLKGNQLYKFLIILCNVSVSSGLKVVLGPDGPSCV